ncbi:UNVERIFIED_CONTAM: hypothetical protein H355_004887 [Colinus virginianus]|nr:hypothetical protein H355_004887 [Colinus virginianus]
MSAAIEREFQEIDATNDWQARYLEIRHKSSDYPHRVAKYPENRNRNRYRDVSPYDHSRVKLQNTENDYINASLVVIEEAQRYYILTQVKCAQYWPTKEEEVMIFSETGFRVRLVSEDIKSYYTVHLLQLENINVSFWQSVYLIFLTFSIWCKPFSTLSLQMEKKDPFSVDIKKVLLDMRKYRMGLIQTPDQLRFSYMAVIEGAKFIMGDSTIQAPSSEQSPPHPAKITTEKYNGNSVGLESKDQMEKINTGLSTKVPDSVDGNIESAVRKRLREDRKANTAQKLQQMKQKLNETERKRKRWLYWKPIVAKVGFGEFSWCASIVQMLGFARVLSDSHSEVALIPASVIWLLAV